jgi:hypothetical protein
MIHMIGVALCHLLHLAPLGSLHLDQLHLGQTLELAIKTKINPLGSDLGISQNLFCFLKIPFQVRIINYQLRKFVPGELLN